MLCEMIHKFWTVNGQRLKVYLGGEFNRETTIISLGVILNVSLDHQAQTMLNKMLVARHPNIVSIYHFYCVDYFHVIRSLVMVGQNWCSM